MTRSPTKHFTTLCRGLVVIVAFLVAAPARAQSTSATAEALFRQGRELMAAGKLAEACAAFEGSQKLDPAATTLLNLGACREKNGQLATAWGVFLDAERATRNGTDPNTQKLHQVALDKARSIEPRVSRLTIHVADPQLAGLEILRDGVRVDPATWNRPLPIDGGTYQITARAPNTMPWVGPVTIAAEKDNKTVEIPQLQKPAPIVPGNPTTPTTTITTPPPGPGAGSMPPPTDTRSRPRSSVPLVLGIGGTVALVGAIGFELWGQSTYNEAKAETVDQARRDSLYDSANSKRFVAQGLAVTGAACVGVAIWMYLHRPPSRTDALRSASVRRIHLEPLAGAATGFALEGSF